MKKIYAIPVWVKKRLDFIIAAILLFMLLSPTIIWDKAFGWFDFFYHVFFPIITLLLALVCAANLIEKKWNFCKWLRENIWFVSFAALLFVSVLISTNRLFSLPYLPYYLSGIFMTCIIYGGELTQEKIRRIFGFAALGFLITAIYAVIQRIQGIEINASFTNLKVNPNMPGRVVSFFGNPNIYGFSLASFLPVIAAYVLISKSRFKAALGVISFVFGVVALIMTYSRGAWFGFAAGIFIFAALYKPKLIPVILILGVAAFPFMPASIKDRIFTIFNPNDTSISYRGILMNCGLQLIRDYPVFGAGLGLETVQTIVHQNYWPSYLDPVYRFYHSHNLFLQLWCEMGVFGVIAFCGAVFHNIICAVRDFRKKNDKQVKILSCSLISGMTAMLMCGMTDCPLNTLRTMLLFWILFGLLGSVRKAEDRVL